VARKFHQPFYIGYVKKIHTEYWHILHFLLQPQLLFIRG